MTNAELAGWLLNREAGPVADPAGLAIAAELICQKLCRGLSRSISPGGSQAILSRALHLARAEFPFLDGVCAGRAPDACFDGLAERVHNTAADEACGGLLAVLAIQLDLLVRFIGEGLTARLVQEVWPDLPLSEPGQAGNSAAQAAA